MALWTDIITPAELTGYARESLADMELQRGTLAKYLPNRHVLDTAVRFVAGGAGLVEEARYRAFDAEPEIGRQQGGKRVSIEMPAVSQKIPVSEYRQLRARNASDAALRDHILKTTEQVVRAVADRVERTRGVVLATGKATIAQSNFVMDDDFGRDPSMAYTAPALFSNASADAFGIIQAAVDKYVAMNGLEPGVMLTSKRVISALGANKSMATILPGGATRPATVTDLQATFVGNGLPGFEVYSRRTYSGAVLPDDRILFLPAPVDPNSGESELGATFWGETLTSLDATYSIESSETPGIVAGVYRNDKPPLIAEVIADSISLPVLANANLSLSLKVL